MSILDRLMGSKGGAIPSNASFAITQMGSEKLQEFNGDDKQMVLMALETNGSMSLQEIAQRTTMTKSRAERVIAKLAQGGYVRLATGSGSMD